MNPEDTLQGRALLELAFDTRNQAKLEDFYGWLDTHTALAMNEIRVTFNQLFASGNKARALKLYDMTAMMADQEHIARGTLLVALLMAAGLGAAAVCVYELLKH